MVVCASQKLHKDHNISIEVGCGYPLNNGLKRASHSTAQSFMPRLANRICSEANFCQLVFLELLQRRALLHLIADLALHISISWLAPCKFTSFKLFQVLLVLLICCLGTQTLAMLMKELLKFYHERVMVLKPSLDFLVELDETFDVSRKRLCQQIE